MTYECFFIEYISYQNHNLQVMIHLSESGLLYQKAVQPNGYTALIHQLFSSEWQ